MDTMTPTRPVSQQQQLRHVSLTAGLAAPAQARTEVRAAICAWDLPVDQSVAALLISELVTNAVMHGHGPIELLALLDESRLTVDISDRGEGFERPRHERDPDAIGGYGLNIVDALASRWGIHEGSSHVWFEIELDQMSSAPGHSCAGRISPASHAAGRRS